MDLHGPCDARRQSAPRLRGSASKIRAGIHTGEVELIGGNVRGLAVHETARIAGAAKAGEVLVSSTTKQLLAGSDLAFESTGFTN